MNVKIERLDDEKKYGFTITDGSVTDIIDLQLFCIDMASAILDNNMGVIVTHEDIIEDLNVEDVNKNLYYLRNEIEAKLDKINNDIDNLLN